MAKLSNNETYYDRHPTELIPARSVVFYRNGDPFFVGRKLVINGKYVPTFDALLSELSRYVTVPQGAVLRIYTPHEGHSVHTLEEIMPGNSYVVASKDSFRQIDYLNITMTQPQKKTKKVIKPVVHSRICVPSRWGNFLKPAFFINVLRNGDLQQSPLRIVLSKYNLNDWNRIRALITDKVQLISGSVQRLYTLDGRLVLGPSELKHNEYYVAVGMEKFIDLPYHICIYKSNKVHPYGSQHDKVPPIQKKKNKNMKSIKVDDKSSRKENPDKALKQRKGSALLIPRKKPSVFYARSSAPEKVTHPVNVKDILLENGSGMELKN